MIIRHKMTHQIRIVAEAHQNQCNCMLSLCACKFKCTEDFNHCCPGKLSS
jgi:hypothetical protein